MPIYRLIASTEPAQRQAVLTEQHIPPAISVHLTDGPPETFCRSFRAGSKACFASA